MKKKALIVSIAILVVIGIFSFVNIFKVGQSFVKHTRFAEGVGDITDANLKKCLNTKLTIAGDDIEQKLANFKKASSNGVLYSADDATDPTSIVGMRCSHSGVTSVAGLTALTGLKYLYLEGNAITGPIDLSTVAPLEEIDVSDNVGVTGLKLPIGMKSLDLDNTGIKSVKDVLMDGKPITDRSALNAKAELLKFKGMTWDNDMKDVILNNASTLKILSLANTGFNDSTLFASNASLFTALEDLNLSNNDLSNISLTGLKTGTFICDSCNLESVSVDRSVLKVLEVPNNNFSSFYAYPNDFPVLTTIDLSGNPLDTSRFDATPRPEMDGENAVGVTDINLSNINFTEFNLAKLNPAKVQKITMQNSNLPSDLDFTSFSNAFRYLDISNHSTKEEDHPNKVSSIRLTFSNTNKNSQLQSLYAVGNESFGSINLEKPAGEENNDVPVLASLMTLDVSFTGISNIDFSKFPGIKNLYLVGCKNFRNLVLNDANANPPYDVKNQIEELGIAMSGLNPDSLPIGSNNLKTIIINPDDAKDLYLDNFRALKKIIVASEKDIYGITTADTFNNDFLLGAIPQNVTDVISYSAYDGYLRMKPYKLDTVPVGKDLLVSLEASNVKIDGFNGFAGIVDYYGYYNVSPIKITSSKYKFDTLNNEKVIVVGNDETGEIVDGVVLSDQDVSKTITEDEKYLVLSKGEVEIAKYRLLRVDPASYNPENPDGGGSGGGSSNPDLPDDPSHSSIDPTENPSSDQQQYETIDPIATGAFISIISLIVLVIAGLFSQYYMKKKRKEEELIEKI